MIKKYKNQDGFTLVEVIISIATLSIISVFILQMFIASAKVNKEAYYIDQSTAIAINTMEAIKSDSPEIYDSFENAYQIKKEGEIIFFKAYDSDFQEVDVSGYSDKAEIPSEVQYISKILLVFGEPVGSDTIITARSDTAKSYYAKYEGTGYMCDIMISMYDYTEKSTDEIITEINGSHYFSNSVFI